MIYKFRIILDVEKDVFRDIEIESQATLEDFHNAITQSFGFEGNEMASFYKSDKHWNQGEEFSLFDTESGALMSDTLLKDIINETQKHLLYVYDFFNMWTFFVELKEIGEYQSGINYPNLLFAHGLIPEQAPEKHFESDALSNKDFQSDFIENFDNDQFDDDFFDDEFDDYQFDQNEFNEYYGYNQDDY